ncbi:tRNA (guanine-N1)-methyltransferase [Paucihalobacter ruber]|uniref:tRNA (Guanine-N1)-methyltransferase n=1 Tax=Paucihalobacter ruber TaxID=2567861 RepID=A0A506PGP4_9FLAO|nr:tRNA (guanine-N1)-methyltransferase [Paucihalobacter ruber]TPV32262.1 tRNA (guanine-N1)-methyltransferase [Paucihalobacter ruber]
MKHQFKFITLIFSFLVVFNVTAQQTDETSEEDKLSLTEGDVENQFEYVIQRSNNYQDYKVVKKVWLQQLKSHVMDSLNQVKSEVVKSSLVIEQQSEELSKLKDDLNSTKLKLDNTITEKDSMQLFGLQLSKTGYSTIMWAVIGVLLLMLFLFIYKFNASNSITNSTKKKLVEVEEEFEEHRRVALEREQKVRRQLQDEINKQKPRK